MRTLMANDTDIRKLVPEDVVSAAEALSRAFYDDPVGKRLFPDDASRGTGLRRLFESEIQHDAPERRDPHESRADGRGSVAAPGHWKIPTLTLTKLLPRFMTIFGRRLPLILRGLFEVEKHHPASESTLRSSLRDAGLDPSLLEQALEDESTMREVRDQHAAAVLEVGAFGVPTILLETGQGMFGPVIAERDRKPGG